ncbi:MAG: hypothetical protein J7641_14290 [Cyanobacteria bacterium SID2]|nr:hypothetical protein [Cyanobacteria bacterium SID2]
MQEAHPPFFVFKTLKTPSNPTTRRFFRLTILDRTANMTDELQLGKR